MTDSPKNSLNWDQNTSFERTLHLLNEAKLDNSHEALAVLLHVFMLETGYIPICIDKSEKYNHLPENWKKNGVYMIQYHHQHHPEVTCWMTCVPLYGNLSVLGAVDSKNHHDDVNVTLEINKHVSVKEDCLDPLQCFLNPKDLSIYFKDNFCYPLLVLLQRALGLQPYFGLNGLMDELKEHILHFLPVEAIVSCSAVSKNFNTIANSQILWKFLHSRDFGKDGIPDISTSCEEVDWKKAYEKEYEKKKLHREALNHPNLDLIYSTHPIYDVDDSFDFDPALAEVFPHLRRRLPYAFQPYFRRIPFPPYRRYL